MSKSHRNSLPPSGEDTIGPYFPVAFSPTQTANLRTPYPGTLLHAKGQPIILTGAVFDTDGNLVPRFLAEFHHPDPAGRSAVQRLRSKGDDPHLGLSTRHYADQGHYHLETVMPGASPDRAPHVTLTLYCDGIQRIVTQIFFPDQPGNADDPLLQSLPVDLQGRLIAQRDGEAGDCLIFRRDIVMRGKSETPFFDDLES
ncbi:MAG: hypothetical protein AAF311_07755 [Pseudomonadota bacterium]